MRKDVKTTRTACRSHVLPLTPSSQRNRTQRLPCLPSTALLPLSTTRKRLKKNKATKMQKTLQNYTDKREEIHDECEEEDEEEERHKWRRGAAGREEEGRD